MTKIMTKKYWYLGIISVIIFLFVWEFCTLYRIIDPIYIGTPHNIFLKLIEMFGDKVFYQNLANSFQSLLLGYFLALLVGVTAGILLGTKEKILNFISPFIYVFNSMPYIAILPLFIIWFGVGSTAKTVMVFLMAVSPIFIYTLDSTGTVSKENKEMLKSFHANELYILKNLTFFHSLPYIFSGARIAIGRSVTAIIISEIYGLGRGLGYFISFYGATFQTDRLMAVVLVVLSINFICINLLKKVESKVVFWENK